MLHLLFACSLLAGCAIKARLTVTVHSGKDIRDSHGSNGEFTQMVLPVLLHWLSSDGCVRAELAQCSLSAVVLVAAVRLFALPVFDCTLTSCSVLCLSLQRI